MVCEIDDTGYMHIANADELHFPLSEMSKDVSFTAAGEWWWWLWRWRGGCGCGGGGVGGAAWQDPINKR